MEKVISIYDAQYLNIAPDGDLVIIQITLNAAGPRN